MKSYSTILLTALSWVALNAQAHTVLSGSAPADKAIETATPKTITLSFSTEVRLMGLLLEDGAGEPVDLGSLPTTTQQEFVIAAPSLQPGAYLVSWRAVGADTHVVSGEFQFEVAELVSRD